MALEFTDSNFSDEVLSANKLCVVDFWVDFCGPCKSMHPIIDELAFKYANQVIVGKVNADRNLEYTTRYEITSFPVIVFFRKGELVYKHVGFIPKDKLDKEIQEYLDSPGKIQDSLKLTGNGNEMPPLPELPLSPKYRRNS